MEATFTLPASANISTWPGFIVQKVGDVNSAYFIGMSNQGWATVGTYQYDPATKSGAVHPGEKWGRDLPLTAGEKVKARLLYRGGMLEMYINDYLFPVWSGVPGSGRLGVSDSSIVTGALAWKMSLPHTATPPVLPPPPPPRPPPPPPAPPPPPGPKLPVGTTGNGTCGATSFGGEQERTAVLVGCFFSHSSCTAFVELVFHDAHDWGCPVLGVQAIATSIRRGRGMRRR